MSDLRRIVVGKTSDPNVRSYIASGNITFSAEGTAEAWAGTLAEAIQTELGFEVPVLVLAAPNMRDLLFACPYQDRPGNNVHGFLCFAPPDIDQAKLEALRKPSEKVALIGQTFWLFAPDGVAKSKLMARAEEVIGRATARNLNTIKKMVKMLEENEPTD